MGSSGGARRVLDQEAVFSGDIVLTGYLGKVVCFLLAVELAENVYSSFIAH